MRNNDPGKLALASDIAAAVREQPDAFAIVFREVAKLDPGVDTRLARWPDLATEDHAVRWATRLWNQHGLRRILDGEPHVEAALGDAAVKQDDLAPLGRALELLSVCRVYTGPPGLHSWLRWREEQAAFYAPERIVETQAKVESAAKRAEGRYARAPRTGRGGRTPGAPNRQTAKDRARVRAWLDEQTPEEQARHLEGRRTGAVKTLMDLYGLSCMTAYRRFEEVRAERRGVLSDWAATQDADAAARELRRLRTLGLID